MDACQHVSNLELTGKENLVGTGEHHYRVTVSWTGNAGSGTSGYRAYERAHEVHSPGKLPILGSSDPKFHGDLARWNPEELLVASLSACHKLWYLHLCASSGVVVTAYEDRAEGVMLEREDGGGSFSRVTLHPRVAVAPGSDVEKAMALHQAAHEKCFIANSVNFAVVHEATVTIA
jgi:organic hydroperoxide reductase OsmC/OhrA